MASEDCLFVVVTGTDTGVGKTWVAAALARELTRRGHRVTAVKPVESGCDEGHEAVEDGAILADATGQNAPRRALLTLRTAVAPPVAADVEGVVVDVGALVDGIRAFAHVSDIVIVEGAGGLCAPLSWTADLLDVAHALDASVLLVGSDRLGVVNHVILTLNTLLACAVTFLGIILSAPAVADASTGTNESTLRRVLGGRESKSEYDRILTVARGEWRDAGSELETAASWVEEALASMRLRPEEQGG